VTGLNGDHLQILVAHDNEDDVFLLRRAFGKAGLRNPVRVVRDGEQTLAYLRGEGEYADRARFPFPGLVLLDVKMPRLNGMEVLEAIRQNPRLNRLVVIVLSSSAQEADVDRAFDLQVNSYLVKPDRPEAMAEIVRRLKSYWLAVNHFPHCPAANPA
jgi:CheY-like chemotaxis protein